MSVKAIGTYVLREESWKTILPSLGNFLRRMGSENRLPIRVVITPYKPKRTEQQNRYLWGVVYADVLAFMREHDGALQLPDGDVLKLGFADLNLDALHQCLKILLIPGDPIIVGERTIFLDRSTAKMNKQEFSDYIEGIAHIAACNGFTISPSEGWLV